MNKFTISLLVGAGGLALYGVACGLLVGHQVKILYRPAKLESGHDDHQLILPKTNDSPQMRGWIDNPGQDAAMLYCGGSSEAIELRRDSLAKAFPFHTRYIMPYRGFGPNAPLSPNEKSIKLDAERLFNFSIKNHRVVDVLGRSLGTSVAAHLAARFPVRKVALITPFDSIVSVARLHYKLIPVGKILRDHHEVWRDAGAIKIPLLACLAGLDTVTPHHLWEKLKKHLPTGPIGHSVFQDTQSDHTSIAQSESLWCALADFFSLGDNVVDGDDKSSPLVIPRIP